MQAIVLRAPREWSSLELEQVDRPQPRDGEAIVRVHAAALTRDELGWAADRLPSIPSYELSGVVDSIGPAVDTVATGDSVFALTPFDRDGVAAEFAVLPAALLAPKPQTLDHVQSAAIPLPALSAWQALFEHGHLQEGERVLIHGATGGVGHFAVQLARHFGAHVIGTASTANMKRAHDLGAHEVLDHTAGPFEEALEPVDLVFDTVGGDLLARSSTVLRDGGRLVTVAEEPPAGVEAVYFVVEPNREQLLELARLADAGELRSLIGSVFPLADARAAFKLIQSTSKQGKIVLSVFDE
jgi:NADPH:quinone reductase-like Zn-dependent oxidoreductase